MQVGDSLVKQNTTPIRKRGRPQENVIVTYTPKRANCEMQPLQNVRTDSIGHFPKHSERRVRCKNLQCNGQSRWFCTKCNVHLCLEKHKNCFLIYHSS